MNADPVVKGVLLLLLAASVWSWAVIIDKLWRLGAASRSVREHEARAAAARSPQELATTGDGPEMRDPAGLVLSAGLAESTAEPRPQPETAGERRERIERAMRLALNANCGVSKPVYRSWRHWARPPRSLAYLARSGGSCAALRGSPRRTIRVSPSSRRGSPRH